MDHDPLKEDAFRRIEQVAWSIIKDIDSQNYEIIGKKVEAITSLCRYQLDVLNNIELNEFGLEKDIHPDD